MEIDLPAKIARHPFWSNKTPSDAEWNLIKSIPSDYKFKQGDKIHDDDDRVFLRYHKASSSGLLLCNVDILEKKRQYAKQRHRDIYVKKGRRTKPLDEKQNTLRIKGKRKRAAMRERAKSDPLYAEKMRTFWRKCYQRRRDKILAMHKNKQKTPYMIARARLNGSIKRHLANLLAGSKHNHCEGAKFLVWLADKQGVDMTKKHEWHIDHIKPIKSFDLHADGVRANVNAPENVRWMKAKDNLLKGSKMPTVLEVISHLGLVAEWRASL